MKNEILYSVKAQRGSTLRCKGWKQECLLRMLENNMENAEAPERLVIYGGIGKCARNWESYHAIVESLMNLENDETLTVQSGMPVAIFKTHRLAPRVVMANTNIMKATWPIFYDLQDKNLTMFAQYTAAPWEYIGTQGVIQGTFETLGTIAKLHFNGSLAGRILFTAGMGGMGANQTRAMNMHGGVCIDVDANVKIIQKRIEKKYCDVLAKSLDEAIALAKEYAARKQPLGIGVVGNAATLFPLALQKDFKPDIVTEMCPCHDPISYIAEGYTPEQAEEARQKDRLAYLAKARESMKKQLAAMNAFHARGIQVFEYGTSIRKECRDAGMPESEAMRIPGFVAAYIRPLFCEGRGPFRWTCLSGEASDLAKLDDLVLEMFPHDAVTTKWVKLARAHLPIEALPARVCYLGFGERKAFGLRVNELIKKKDCVRAGRLLAGQFGFRLHCQPHIRIRENARRGRFDFGLAVSQRALEYGGHGRPGCHPGELLHGRSRSHRRDHDRRRERGSGSPLGSLHDHRFRYRGGPPRPGRLPNRQSRRRRTRPAHERGDQGSAVVEPEGHLRSAGRGERPPGSAYP